MTQAIICPPPQEPPKDTSIPVLGPAKIPSTLTRGRFIDESSRVMVYSKVEDVRHKSKKTISFEEAGPRENIYFDPSKTKCAIATCGGLCPGINDVIRAIVLEASHNYHVAATLGIRYGLEGFIPSYGHEVVELTPATVSRIHEFGGTVLGSSRGPQPVDQIVDTLERLNVGILFLIGGDGTMRAAARLVKEISDRGVKIAVIGVPKTIDNDINFISQSFGFDTAVEKVTEAIRCAHTEALGAPNGIGMVKVMGRESGFIAAQAALALRDVDFVLVPEDPFELTGEHGFLAALTRRLKKRHHAVVVVAEGAGQHLCEQTGRTDASGNVRLANICSLLIEDVKAHLKGTGMDFALKFIDPSYIIRSVSASSNDSIYCGFLGQNAVHAAMAGKTGMVVSKWSGHYVHMPLALVTDGRKRIDICSNYWRAVLESTGQHVYFDSASCA